MVPEITSFSAGGLQGYYSKGTHGSHILHPLGRKVLRHGSGSVEAESLEPRLAVLISSALPPSRPLEEGLLGDVMLLHSWRRPDMLSVQSSVPTV